MGSIVASLALSVASYFGGAVLRDVWDSVKSRSERKEAERRAEMEREINGRVAEALAAKKAAESGKTETAA